MTTGTTTDRSQEYMYDQLIDLNNSNDSCNVKNWTG